ncbi:phosphoenolpyruvate--protein phosphotransferase [Lutibaculum baratangense]|uniref:phosphoenolpyruvate--protein phosphotransferase n=1 Tax=Lutibaculum baratangense AMV1 TaxID=631454 RepID=V4RD55_9HYPH|nr:phosphoenolpyruvate--protein phosphotransferase [Lutibaculum baratangense]ESR24081.1 Phosphocarrier protein kinase/phosphorylase, nitrogen regulation associated [Lutibaculum baratangense AMV1]
MRGSIVGPRVMLRRLRELMAEPVNAQERLDKIVVTIASNMVAEVCSVYVLREDGTLELFATEGLKREAVHLTSLKLGEGLVGTIAAQAESLNLSDAQGHPAFAYRPETGEESYSSFLGVPILRGGQTLGVLVVQNRASRVYSEEEVEAMQTTAMVMAEMIAGGELEALVKTGEKLAISRPRHLFGHALSEGIGLGHAVLHEPRIVLKNLIAEDASQELARLDAALRSLRTSIDALLSRTEIARPGEHREVFEAFRMFAHDRGWVERMREAVMSGLTAEAAVERVQNDTRARMQRQTDPYIRERLHDLDDLANRLLRELVGWAQHPAKADLPKDAILIARSMGPAELLDYDRDTIRALVLEEGAPTSHISIVARAMGIAAVGQVEGVLDLVDAGDSVIVDGLSGEVHIRPTAEVERAYIDKVRFRARRQEQYRQLRDRPSRTKDGQDIKLLLNAGLLVDLAQVSDAGAAGIGLFRTELQFMVSATFPRMRDQRELYRSVIDAAGELPVTFRSLDIGGDKMLPYIATGHEENPALGWRAIRMALDRPALLRTQIRALLHAAAGRQLRLMFPMLTEVAEFDRARDLVENERQHLLRHGHEIPHEVLLGTMIEVPSVLWQLDELVAKVDFLSVGSNDLLQFMYAADRTNSRVAGRFDELAPAPLRALRTVVEAADLGGVPLTLCGEMAGRPISAMALLGIGFRAISMAPSAMGPVKAMILSLDLQKLQDWLLPELAMPRQSLREDLVAFARDHDVQL